MNLKILKIQIVENFVKDISKFLKEKYNQEFNEFEILV